MCNKKTKTIDGASQSQTNVGLVNLASETFGDGLDVETVLEIASFVILVLLIFRWAKKWCVKRSVKKRTQLREILSEAPSQPPPRAQNIPMLTLQSSESAAQLASPPMYSTHYAAPAREIWTKA